MLNMICLLRRICVLEASYLGFIVFSYNYRNINLAHLSDNHKFWKTVKLLFSDKVQLNTSIALIEDGKMITEHSEIAEVFNILL